MSQTIDVSVIVGFKGEDILKSYSEDELYDIIEDNDLSFADSRGRGEYDDGIIGYQIFCDSQVDINAVIQKYDQTIEKYKHKAQNIFPNVSIQPKLYCAVGVC